MLLKAVRWRISNLWRDQTRHQERLDQHPPKPAALPTPDQQTSSREALERIDAAVCLLPPRQEEVARMSFLEDATAPEIAAALDLAVPTVRETLRKARIMLKDELLTDLEDLE